MGIDPIAHVAEITTTGPAVNVAEAALLLALDKQVAGAVLGVCEGHRPIFDPAHGEHVAAGSVLVVLAERALVRGGHPVVGARKGLQCQLDAGAGQAKPPNLLLTPTRFHFSPASTQLT